MKARNLADLSRIQFEFMRQIAHCQAQVPFPVPIGSFKSQKIEEKEG